MHGRASLPYTNDEAPEVLPASGACLLYAFTLHRATGYIELLNSIYFSIINIKHDRFFSCRRVIGVDMGCIPHNPARSI